MIVVFGSINVDILMTLERLPRPGETVHGRDYRLAPGGKGANQACAAARAAGDGARVAMVGRVGQDAWGPVATRLLEEAGVDLSRVEESERPTGCATIWIDAAGENAIAVASGANTTVTASQVPDEWLGPDTRLVLQMEVPAGENWTLVERARARGARILLNLAPANPAPRSALDEVDVLVVNEIEAAMTAQAEGLAGAAGTAEPRALARLLAGRHGLACIVTLGAGGAVAVEADGTAWAVDALALTPVDTTGAGDAFTGVLAASLAAGAALPEAMRRASVGAGLACLEVGCQSSFVDAAAIAARLDEVAPAAREAASN